MNADVDMFIYVLRSVALKARDNNIATLRKRCLESLSNIVVADVTAHDPCEITGDLVKSIVDITAGPEVEPEFAALLKPMHVNQLSNNLKHFTAMRMVVENGKHFPNATHVVVEDDVLFNDDVVSMLATTTKSAPAAYDIVFLGLPSTKTGTPNEVSFESTQGIFKLLPCCDSYVIDKKAAAAMVTAYLPIRFPTQVQLSHLMKKLQLAAYICSPNVFIDGSKLGVFMSSIEQNNLLLWNPQFNQIRAILAKAKESKSLAGMEEVDALLKSAHFKDHPDFRYLAATAHAMNGRYDEARIEFDRAFDVYVAERCVFGPDCQFMKDFVQIFRYLQPVD